MLRQAQLPVREQIRERAADITAVARLRRAAKLFFHHQNFLHDRDPAAWNASTQAAGWPWIEEEAVGVFAVEVAIGRYVQSGFVRTFLGDVLVVVLVYFAVRGLCELAPRWTALGVFLFACPIELGQAVGLEGLSLVLHDT
jgi:hypothetical protein